MTTRGNYQIQVDHDIVLCVMSSIQSIVSGNYASACLASASAS